MGSNLWDLYEKSLRGPRSATLPEPDAQVREGTVVERASGPAPMLQEPAARAQAPLLRRPITLWAWLLSLFLVVATSVGLSILIITRMVNVNSQPTEALPTAETPSATITEPVLTILEFVSPEFTLTRNQPSAQIAVRVFDQYDQPMDGVEVTFVVSPPGGARLSSYLVVSKGGRATTELQEAAGRAHRDVTITARANGKEAQATISVEPQPEPGVEVTARAAPETPVAPGGSLAFVLTVRNTGNTQAQGVTAYLQLPDGVVSPVASNGGHVDEQGLATWVIGDLAPGTESVRQVNVQVNPDFEGVDLVLPRYGAMFGPDQEVVGMEQVEVAVEQGSIVSAPAQITLVVEPTSLAADGKATANLVAQVLTADGVAYQGTEQVTFEWQPAELGTAVPLTAPVGEGKVEAAFTAANQAGHVTIVARISNLTSESVELELTDAFATAQTGKTSDMTHLLPVAEAVYDKLVIFQLPRNTSVSLLGETATDDSGKTYEKVGLEVWLPSAVIAVDEQGRWRIVRTDVPVLVGTPENPQTGGERMLQSGATDYSVEIVDDSRVDLKKVRIVGWMFAELIEADQ